MIHIGDGLTTVALDDEREWRIDLIETAMRMNKILDAHKADANYAYLTAFAEFLKDRWKIGQPDDAGALQPLRPSQAERLWQQVDLMLGAQKAEFRKAMEAAIGVGEARGVDLMG